MTIIPVEYGPIMFGIYAGIWLKIYHHEVKGFIRMLGRKMGKMVMRYLIYAEGLEYGLEKERIRRL